jgi:hypothetical protein
MLGAVSGRLRGSLGLVGLFAMASDPLRRIAVLDRLYVLNVELFERLLNVAAVAAAGAARVLARATPSKLPW